MWFDSSNIFYAMLAIVGQPLYSYFVVPWLLFCNWFGVRISWWKFTQLTRNSNRQILIWYLYKIKFWLGTFKWKFISFFINYVSNWFMENWPTLAEKIRYWFTKKNAPKKLIKGKTQDQNWIFMFFQATRCKSFWSCTRIPGYFGIRSCTVSWGIA